MSNSAGRCACVGLTFEKPDPERLEDREYGRKGAAASCRVPLKRYEVMPPVYEGEARSELHSGII